MKTLIIDVDFTSGDEIYDRIGKEIEGLEIGVLINNVGMSYSYPEYLAQVISLNHDQLISYSKPNFHFLIVTSSSSNGWNVSFDI